MILNLSNFIYSLLLENETVIIPGFGAFVSTYQPAEIVGNEIKPPSKEISFTQKIKSNDGMLAEIIARKAKISQSYAMKRIDKARENMLYELDKGETVIIENVGTLIYNEKNEIQFTAFNDENLLLDSFGLETISTIESFKEANNIWNKTNLIGELDVQVDGEEKIDEKEKEPASEQKEETTEPEPETVIHSAGLTDVELVQEEKPKKVQAPEFKTAEKPERQEERKKFGWYWYLLILIPVFIGVFFIINNKSKTNESLTEIEEGSNIQPQNIQPETVIQPDSAENNSTEPIETEAALNVNEESKLSNGTSKFYVVGGGFKDEENLEKYILKLKGQGINGFNLGQKGKLYLVGIDSFDNETDAQIFLNKLKKQYPGWNLWIFEK